MYPTVGDAKKRLEYLITNGETPYAFTFRSKYTQQDFERYKAEGLIL